eukprot:COSAG04_NODE_1288_length_7365_cov_12.007707_5_plen_127_part_00
MEAAGSPAQSPAGAQAPLSPERQPVHLMGQATVTPETTPDRAMSPPEALRGRNPPDPTEEVVWFPTPLKPLEILDAMAHPAVYVSAPCTHPPTRARALSPHGSRRATGTDRGGRAAKEAAHLAEPT